MIHKIPMVTAILAGLILSLALAVPAAASPAGRPWRSTTYSKCPPAHPFGWRYVTCLWHPLTGYWLPSQYHR